MTKGELTHAISQKTGQPVKDVKKFLDGFIDVVTENLKTGRNVNITGFGRFYVTEKKEREGRNPATGKTIKIPAHKTPAFKAGQVLKKTLNEN